MLPLLAHIRAQRVSETMKIRVLTKDFVILMIGSVS